MSARRLLPQVVVLLLSVMLAVLAIGFVVVLLTPTPVSPPMTIDAALAALTDEEPTRDDAPLQRRIETLPPVGPPADLVVAAASARLGVSADEVRAVWLRQTELQPVVEVLAADAAIADPRSLVDVPGLIADRRVALPPFELARRTEDGRWQIAGPRQRLFSGWRLRLLAGSMLGALAVLPIAWFAARRLTRPVRALAEAAAEFDLHGRGPTAEVYGPAEVQAAALAFNAMRERIRAQAAERTRMVAAVAHDLRTPLTGLRLRAESAPTPLRERMVADIRRMESMIAQVLDFARGEEAPPITEAIDLVPLLREAAEIVRDAGGEVVLALPQQAPRTADPVMLRRAIDNLLDNAVRYGKRARLRLARETGWWVITIEDEGPGVPTAELPRLGDPFHRLESSRNRTTGGIGLGLSIARTVAGLHGGYLAFENLPSGGLRASLYLPAD
jgi:two-component system OmpR family sensor kinase